MDNNRILEEIFNNDPLGLLNIKPTSSPQQSKDERLIATFYKINEFYEKNNREPQQDGSIQEYQLYARLKAIRDDRSKSKMLVPYDNHLLLNVEHKQINTLEDVVKDDVLGLLEDDSEGLFNIKHIGVQDERASADFVAQRKPCKDFDKYEPIFRAVQEDLAQGKRKIIMFKEDVLREGGFYVHNGVLLQLEKVEFKQGVAPFKSGDRLRKDGRTRVIFENGTESNMLYRSLYKALLANGRAVSENVDRVNESFVERFSNITNEDEAAGYIYILKSKSEKKEIREIKHLYKIGYSKTTVEDRIINANQDPTYLMADVQVLMVFKCFNLNPQKLEMLLHNFFGKSCLNIDVFDAVGIRHTPREWFIAPLSAIEQAIKLIISGEIVNYRYDGDNEIIINR
ncbi:MAG: GIY-YIG nuclease family protein [Candidatus Margulisiibacteriota bacterium]|jgi:hypothetical protein